MKGLHRCLWFLVLLFGLLSWASPALAQEAGGLTLNMNGNPGPE
ncbi:MAG: hypothetical protein ACOC9D_05825 [Thermodesulfobacteriota bacterium]